MLRELLLTELILKGAVGAVLLLAPITVCRAMGLPHGGVGLWARIAGTLLIGIAAALWVENDVAEVRGLGIGGLIAINTAGLVILLTLAIAGPISTRRGAFAVWTMVVVLFGLTIFEIAHL
ncbi:MAG: hypothetical protein ACFCUN_02000 [Hyphomicrobiaceae bacterium]